MRRRTELVHLPTSIRWQSQWHAAMTLKPEQKPELDEALLDSLLRQAYVGDPQEAQRITTLLARLDADTVASNNSMSKSYRTSNRWISVALAALVLLFVAYSLTNLTTNNAAYAAVMRSLEVTPSTRAYRIRMVHQRPVWGKREVTADLYLNDQDQFVVRHPGWSRFGDVWIGGGATGRWIAPRFGPAFVGGEDTVGSWLMRKDIPSPYLHVSTILKRLSRAYRLRMLSNESLPQVDSPSESILCQHVVGELRQSNLALPAEIELWANVDTGMAHRLELTWRRAESERGPIQWSIDLVGTPNLPSNWFELEGHVAKDRKIVPIKSTAELDAAENDNQ